jgi:hypothetical protein
MDDALCTMSATTSHPCDELAIPCAAGLQIPDAKGETPSVLRKVCTISDAYVIFLQRSTLLVTYSSVGCVLTPRTMSS